VTITIVDQDSEKNISELIQLIADRAARGWDLYLRRRQLITKTGADSYEVPSCKTNEVYTVRYGDEVEVCTCTDYGVHRGEVACKHLTAVALMYARRRQRNMNPSVGSAVLDRLAAAKVREAVIQEGR
jgi:hypothetical protein